MYSKPINVYLRSLKGIAIFVLIAFIGTIIAPMPVDAEDLRLPVPGVRVHLSPDFSPVILKGITVHPENPLQFDFILDQGDSLPKQEQLKTEASKLVKYFLASLTIPEQDLWVNLSPYEKSRIIPDDFGKTGMGRDLLAEDYILKQITASLMYPEEELGKKFWNKVYAQAYKEFGTTNIAVNTFNKVWIIPDQATVYENGNTAYVLKSHLKVMLEEDYLSLNKHSSLSSSQSKNIMSSPNVFVGDPGINKAHSLGSQVVRQIVLPELEKEVNEGKNFALLRQVNNSLILATWFKKRLKESILGRIYMDRSKVRGVDQNPANNLAIYKRYLKAYRKGVYNYIKEDVDQYTNEVVPRKYFSGGFSTKDGSTDLVQRVDIETKRNLTKTARRELSDALQNAAMLNTTEDVTIDLSPTKFVNRAMNASVSSNKIIMDMKRKFNGDWHDLNKSDWHRNYIELLKEQGIPVQSFELAVLKDLVDAIHKYYEARDKRSGIRIWTKMSEDNRGDFIKPTDKNLTESLRKNGFFNYPEYIGPLVKKYLKRRVITREHEHLITVDVEPDAKSIKYMEDIIGSVLEKFRKGKLQWPELGISRGKQLMLKYHSILTPEVVLEILAAVSPWLFVGPFIHLGTHAGILPSSSELTLKAIDLVAGTSLDLLIFSRIQERLKQRSESAFHYYNESFLHAKIMNLSPEEKALHAQEYQEFFKRLGDYFEGNKSSPVILKYLERNVRVGLEKLEMNWRAARALNHAVDINEAWKDKEHPLVSLNSLVILMFKELSDQNPGQLLKMEKEWQKKSGVQGDIFNRALKNVRYMNQEFYDLLKEKIMAGKSTIVESDLNREMIKLKYEGTYDDLFLDRLYTKLTGHFSSAQERKDIIISRFFIGAYSRLKQMREDFFKNKPLPLIYAQRLILNTEHILTILEKIKDSKDGNEANDAKEKYGLSPQQLGFMIKELNEAKEGLEGILPKNPQAQGKDKAMGAVFQKGGIDLNPANQNLVIQGKGSHFILPNRWRNLDQAQISGFVPIVVQIKPITDLYKVLGMGDAR